MTPGTELGYYEILDAIGAGGMREVYRARDTRLDRIVAIKTSKEQFSESFEREARAVAAPDVRGEETPPSHTVMVNRIGGEGSRAAPRYNKPMEAVDNIRLDRSAFEIVTLDEEGDDRRYWQSRSPQERM